MDDLREIRRLRASRYANQRESASMEVDSGDTRRRSRSPRRSVDDELRVLSWNVDGLDSEGDDVEDMLGRTLWIVKTINECRPHVVFLQELIDFNLQIFRETLGKSYTVIVQSNPRQPYFVGILVHKATVDILGAPSDIPFPTSKMGRGGVAVRMKLKGSTNTYECITCHFESLRESSGERIYQLSIMDDYIRKQQKNENHHCTVIVGGDLNIRDNEVPNEWKVRDSWILGGRDKENEFTWDLQLNDNARMPNGGKPRCRFDRLYLFSSKNKTQVPKAFSLVGKERVPGLGRFASDHFGILLSLANGHVS